MIMNKRMIKYPKIKQFRNIVSDVTRNAEFIGIDENQNAVYDNSNVKPTVTFTGTVKLHGTNAAVCYNSLDGLYFQSRNNILTVGNDNAGFAVFAESKREIFRELVDKIINDNDIVSTEYTISIFGEWAGRGIQRGVGISELGKSFFIFGVKITTPLDSYWVDSYNLRCLDFRIYNIYDYETFSIDIDFNNPELSRNTLISITEEVEKECPVSKSFGVFGIGEGVVWVGRYNEQIYRFKVKGEKHSVTKVKKLVPVNVEKMKSIDEFTDYCVTENRLNQGMSVIFSNEEPTRKKLGDLIRWVVTDILTEEIDVLIENGLEGKDVKKSISTKARNMFFSKGY